MENNIWYKPGMSKLQDDYHNWKMKKKAQLLTEAEEEAYSRLFKEDFERAYLMAEEGDINALYDVGYCYSHAIAVENDEKEAFEWFLNIFDYHRRVQHPN